MFIQTWDEYVAREARHHARVEAMFNRADACERVGDFALGLEWLRKADRLAGGLPPTYLDLRERWAREALWTASTSY
jgi:hypothetical protein